MLDDVVEDRRGREQQAPVERSSRRWSSTSPSACAGADRHARVVDARAATAASSRGTISARAMRRYQRSIGRDAGRRDEQHVAAAVRARAPGSRRSAQLPPRNGSAAAAPARPRAPRSGAAGAARSTAAARDGRSGRALPARAAGSDDLDVARRARRTTRTRRARSERGTCSQLAYCDLQHSQGRQRRIAGDDRAARVAGLAQVVDRIAQTRKPSRISGMPGRIDLDALGRDVARPPSSSGTSWPIDLA